MPDDTNTTDQGQATDQDTGATSDASTQTDATTNTGTENAGTDQASTTDATDGNGAKDTQTEEEDDNAEPEVKQRMSPKDYIIQRQQNKIAKLKASQEAETPAEDDDDGVLPEDEEIINKVVDKRFAAINPILQESIQNSIAAKDDAEINAFLTENPDFKQFEAKARRFMAHESRRSIPVKSIFYEVAGDKLLKIGADRARKADEEARATQTGGGSNRASEGGEKTVFSLSEEEFKAKQEAVRRGR